MHTNEFLYDIFSMCRIYFNHSNPLWSYLSPLNDIFSLTLFLPDFFSLLVIGWVQFVLFTWEQVGFNDLPPHSEWNSVGPSLGTECPATKKSDEFLRTAAIPWLGDSMSPCSFPSSSSYMPSAPFPWMFLSFQGSSMTEMPLSRLASTERSYILATFPSYESLQ